MLSPSKTHQDDPLITNRDTNVIASNKAPHLLKDMVVGFIGMQTI